MRPQVWLAGSWWRVKRELHPIVAATSCCRCTYCLLSVWFEAQGPSGHTTITTNSTTKTTTTVMDKTMLENAKDIKYEDYILIQATGE